MTTLFSRMDETSLSFFTFFSFFLSFLVFLVCCIGHKQPPKNKKKTSQVPLISVNLDSRPVPTDLLKRNMKDTKRNDTSHAKRLLFAIKYVHWLHSKFYLSVCVCVCVSVCVHVTISFSFTLLLLYSSAIHSKRT